VNVWNIFSVACFYEIMNQAERFMDKQLATVEKRNYRSRNLNHQE